MTARCAMMRVMFSKRQVLEMIACRERQIVKELRAAEKDIYELVFNDKKLTEGEQAVLKDVVTIAIERIEKIAKELDGDKVTR